MSAKKSKGGARYLLDAPPEPESVLMELAREFVRTSEQAKRRRSEIMENLEGTMWQRRSAAAAYSAASFRAASSAQMKLKHACRFDQSLYERMVRAAMDERKQEKDGG